MDYLITVTKPYKDIVQLDGKQLVIESPLRFILRDISKVRLPEAITALSAAGYVIETVEQQTY